MQGREAAREGRHHGEGNRDHETDDHHAGLRRWSDAGKGGRHPLLDPGFERGGWARPLFDSEAIAFVDQVYQRADAFLFGRADLRGLPRLGRSQQSRVAYDKAIELAGNTAETVYLTRRRDQLG